MMTSDSRQLPLWDTAPVDDPPTNHQPTSRAAFESIEPVAGTLSSRCLARIRSLGEYGATIDELSQDLAMLTQTVCGRIADLRKRGLIRDSGRTRPTRTRRKAIVWVSAEV